MKEKKIVEKDSLSVSAKISVSNPFVCLRISKGHLKENKDKSCSSVRKSIVKKIINLLHKKILYRRKR